MHIVQRGHNRHSCFEQETDYLVYLSNLRDLSKRTGCALHAYCLMTNHVHMLVTPSTAQSCALMMRNLGQRYVQYFNRRYGRRGTLWEGRYRSCLVESAEYVVACYRYIDRNPVRARMVPLPGDYAWSSYRGNAGIAANALLSPHAEYEALGLTGESRRNAYQELCAMQDDPAFLASIRDATNGGFALISDRVRALLPAHQQQGLTRKSPGPAPQSTHPDHLANLELELGLRPRIRL